MTRRTEARRCWYCNAAIPIGDRARYCRKHPVRGVSCRVTARRRRSKVWQDLQAAFADGRAKRDAMVPLELLPAKGLGAVYRRRGWAEREREIYHAAIGRSA